MKISTVKDIKDALMNEYGSYSKCHKMVQEAMYNMINNVNCDNEYESVYFGFDENAVEFISFPKSVLNTEWKDGWAAEFLNSLFQGILFSYFKRGYKKHDTKCMYLRDVCNFSGNYVR